jgi:hypothetical protein
MRGRRREVRVRNGFDPGSTEPVGSRGVSPSLLSSRASWCSYHREALTLLPLRDWPCRSQGWRPGPSRLAGGDAVPEAQPGCRRGVGKPESRLVLPEADRPPGRSRFAGGDMGPGHRRLRPEVTRIRTTTGSRRRWDGNPDGTTSSTPRGDSRHRPDDGAEGAEEPDGRGGRHHHLNPRASWCSYHQVTFKPPPSHRLAGGRWGRTGAKIHTARQLAAPAR